LPTFTIRPSNIIVSETKSIILPCSVDGFPLPTITWVKEGISVTWHTQLESGALSIDSVDVTDEGQYECVAINTAEIEIRTSMVLTVQALCTEGKCVIFEAIYRDFKMDSVNTPSFLSSAPLSGHIPNIVDWFLGSQNVPALRYLDLNMSAYSDFPSWFTDSDGINSPLNSSLRLDRNNAVYVFTSDSFFPVDNVGFVNNTIDLKDCNEETRNFGFTSVFQSAFRYEGNETLVVHGSDDIWVFVDKTMALDLGGTHGPLCQEMILPGAGLTVNRTGSGMVDSSIPACVGEAAEELSPLTLRRELQVGQFYRLDIFHAQRHSCIGHCPNCTSTFHIATTIQAANFANQVLILVVEEGVNITDPIGHVIIHDYNVLFEEVVNYTFTIKEGNDGGRFAINNSSGEIQLLTALDYEEATDYMLVVEVSDAQDPNRTAVVAVSVEVIDVNDNTPSVIPLYKEVEVYDMAEGGFPIMTFVAEDADSGNNGQLVISVADVTLVNKGRDKIEFNVTVSVADKGIPPNTVNSTIIVGGPVVCSGSSFIVDQSTLQLKIVSAKYYIDPVNRICLPCEAGYFCKGDGLRRKCGCARNNSTCGNIPSEYSNGLASECSLCPEGWICSDGRADPCENGFYAELCGNQECQEECLLCPAGSACIAGKRTPCRAGTYERERVQCSPCPPGLYSNGTSNTRCQCCPAGYQSTHSKDGCKPCRENEWSAVSYDDKQCGICRTCTLNDNCTCQHRPCFPGVQCVNLVGQTPSFSCLSCPLGYEGNGINCYDLNECTHAAPCSTMTQCINTSPGYMCTACPSGYTGHVPHGIGLEHATQQKQVCDDIDECKINNGGCDVRSTCINEPSTYSCSACEPGYIGNGYTGCLLGDLCELGTHSCHENAICITAGLGEFECKCMHGYTGNGFYCGKDSDFDGFPDSRLFCRDRFCFKDNCPDKPNSGQENEDGDGFGDACDDDIDNDGWLNYKDNCPYVYNTGQSDFDGDGVGNACDNCWNYTNPLKADNDTRNPLQLDTDRDGLGDMCEHDRDGDGFTDEVDNCEFVYNPDQNDLDTDGVGDACDNCIWIANPPLANNEQADSDRDFMGNECDDNVDSDHDGVQDSLDNCQLEANSDQLDTDGDSTGDMCDTDTDNDTIDDVKDNCPVIPNINQTDLEGDGRGDACQNDFDGDGVLDTDDACSVNPLISQTNFTSYLNVSVNFDPSNAPEWIITDQGAEVTQKKSSNAAFLLSKELFQAFDFSGTVFVDTNNDDDLIGIVFGYQDIGHFYLVSWKGRTEQYFRHACGTATATGLSVKKHYSQLTESCLRNAIWHSHSYYGASTPLFTSSVSWKHRTAYTFHVTHRPSVGLIQVVIENENGTVADTGQLFDFSYAGGRIGLFCFSQENVIWSNLKYSCAERINHALEFDGIDDSVDLPEAARLSLDRRY
jgi:syndecan 4